MRIGHPLQQDLRRRRLIGSPRRLERPHEGTEVLLEQVVAEVHDEVVVAQEVRRDQHAVGKAERFILRDEGDLRPPRGTVTEGGHHLGSRLAHDDADLGDASGHHRLDAVEENRLVGNRNQLLRARVGDGAQAGARTACQDQSLHK